MIVNLVVPLQAHSGRIWHTLERECEVDVAGRDPDDGLALSLKLEVDGQPVTVEAAVPVRDLLEFSDPEVVIDPPIVVDPTRHGGEGIVDEDGRVDGHVLIEEDRI